jgi:hypothetical protein
MIKMPDRKMLNKKLSRCEELLKDKEKEVDYYKKIAQEAGHKRLLEIYQMNQLIEGKKKAEMEREKVIKDLKTALDEVKILQGFIPICASCKNIRDDTGYWSQVEQYLQKHSEVTFSHSICPECVEKLYGQEEWYHEYKNKKDRKLE